MYVCSICILFSCNVCTILQASGEAQYVSDMIVSNALAAAFVLSTEVRICMYMYGTAY